MHCHFSEFSYGFALSHEIASRLKGKLVAAPEFPSLVREGRDGGGYDAAIAILGVPIFLQFKLSEFMQRPTAREWAQFGAPYYRFWLHAPRHSRQHDLLLHLEGRGNLVFYAAPSFHTITELNAAFLRARVVGTSAFVQPSAIGPVPDSDAHSVAFQQGLRFAWLHSEPRPIELSSFGDQFLEVLTGRQRTRIPVAITSAFFANLADELTVAVGEFGVAKQVDVDFLSRLPPESRAPFIARTALGAELFVLRSELAS